ncbi:hypothetical protein C9446_05390 [Providencia heimbachae]|uniref:hypothetical protein n=1 Tax=Providencia heimbachae TaxID=333962 RepID=UPI0010BE91A1|nr:hypothetical protein C9446_05390 [Providencia heimbachae]
MINWGCPACKEEHQQERFEGFERIQWDSETPVTMFFGDKYFFDIDEIRDHCAEYEVSVDDLKLVLCEPSHPHQLDPNDVFVDKRLGYEVPFGYRFDKATHPQEVALFDMACTAFNVLRETSVMDALNNIEDDE